MLGCRRKTIRTALLGLALSVLAAAAAQQPLVVPNYYLFQLPELPVDGQIEGELSETDGQNFKDGSRLDVYSLHAEQGESLYVQVVSQDFEPVLSIFDSEGGLVAYNDYGMEFGNVSTSFLAQAGGRYFVIVSGWTDYDLGSYVLSRGATRGGIGEATAVTLPYSGTSQITADMAPDPNGYGGGVEYYSFDVEEELLVMASMVSSDIDPVLTLYDASGNIIATNDDDGFTTDSVLAALVGPGSYVLAASTYFTGETGTYSLSLETFYRR